MRFKLDGVEGKDESAPSRLSGPGSIDEESGSDPRGKDSRSSGTESKSKNYDKTRTGSITIDSPSESDDDNSDEDDSSFIDSKNKSKQGGN